MDKNLNMSSIFDLFKQIETEKPIPKPITHIVAGLGNPGSEYTFTRHNCGFLTVDYISQKLNIKVNRARFSSLTAEADISDRRVLIMKPQIYMNKSGEAIREAADFYKIAPENITVIFDDVSLAPGRLRIKRKGSAGGHNGIKNIIEQLQSDNFPRIKLGVGSPPSGGEMVNWVLGGFPEEDKEAVFQAIGRAYEALKLIVSDKIEDAMCEYNR